MGRLGKWIKSLFKGKKDKEKKQSKYSITESVIFTKSALDYVPPPVIPKENVGWSSQKSLLRVPTTRTVDRAEVESWIDQKQALVAAATARQAAAYRRGGSVEETAAVMIQSVFRSYLARKALRALKGLVKVQALVRGYLVRKRTKETLWCMQSLVTAQDRARAQRIRMTDESNFNYQIQSKPRRSVDNRPRHSSKKETNWGMDEAITKIVEMDLGESKRSTTRRNSFSSTPQAAQKVSRFSKQSVPNRAYSKQEHRDLSLQPSALLKSAPRARSMRFDDYYFDTDQNSSRHSSKSEYPSYAQTHHQAVPNRAYSKQEHRDSSLQPSALIDSAPRSLSMRYDDYYFDTAQSSPLSVTSKAESDYMENTEPSRGKVERTTRPRVNSSTEASIRKRDANRIGKNVKSSGRDGTGGTNNVDPWFTKLARVSASGGRESKSEASITSLTNTGNGRSVLGYEVHGNRY